MIRLLIDEDFNQHMADGLVLRDPSVDWLHVRDVGLASAADPAILEWAAVQDRVLPTHDRQTIPAFAYARVSASQPMPGVFLVGDDMPVGEAIDEILLAVHCLPRTSASMFFIYFPI